MQVRLHANATCTPAIRRYIYENRHRPTAALQRELNLSRNTVVRWKRRPDGQDASSRPHNLQTSFEDWQEELIADLRCTFLLPLDDLLVMAKRFIKHDCTRSSLDRLLRRRGISRLADLVPQEVSDDGQVDDKKGKFKQYPTGYLHIDIKYLPKMPDENQHGYLFVAIDRCTRWVFLEVYPAKTAANAQDFLRKVRTAFPGEIHKILTDNGREFTDRFCRSGEREPTGAHLFDLVCAEAGIEHRLTKPKTPKTNGMVERFNGRIATLLSHNRVATREELRTLLLNYMHTYNNIIPQRALKHQTPAQALAQHLKHQPNLPGPDTYP
jgi:transposase InsO family protein